MDIKIDDAGREVRVALTGSLNTNTVGELEAALEPVLSGGAADSLVFDFAGLEYISSAGLRVLMMAFKRLGGGGVAVENASTEVRDVFDITGFSALFDIR